MHFAQHTLLVSLALPFTHAAIVFPRQDYLGQHCTIGSDAGTCQSTSDCTTQGYNEANHCPGPSSIQCCVKKTCGSGGTCLNKPSDGSGCSGSWKDNLCPGDESIKCCVPGSDSSPPDPAPDPPAGGSTSAADKIVSAAVSQEGLPYVWGGGGCSGKSSGGFDCSGLTQYAVCQAGLGTIPRTAQTQYHSDKGKHLPLADAKKGDLIFWGEGGDCVNNVAHVGIFMRKGWMVNAAHTGTPVREQEIWTSSGGESACDDAVRFW